MQYTANFNLKLPEATDYYSIDDFNENASLIDKVLDVLNRLKADLNNNGKIPISELPDDSPTSETVAEALELTGDDPRVNAAILKLLELLGGKAASSHYHAASDITSGILPVTRGGSGQSSAAKALYAFINGAGALAAAGPATGDYVGLVDVSASTGKKVTLSNLVSFLNTALGVARIATGSYVGTGTYGDMHTLTFAFAPRAFILFTDSDEPRIFTNMNTGWKGGKYGFSLGGVESSERVPLTFTWAASFKWYGTYDYTPTSGAPAAEYNESGTTYYYVAIG